MKTSLITREEMIEAIENHTLCISTKDIPSVAANYLMITKEFYSRKDRNVINRILLSEIRDYLVEQGRIPFAEVAAERRKEAEAMKKISVTGIQHSDPKLVPGDTCKQEDPAPHIPVLEWEGVRVVTTRTLANGYACAEKSIRMNLANNKSRFIEGMHIFTVSGKELADLRANMIGSQISSKARTVTLWTEKGAARMSKIVDTDEAWAFFEKLEESYFQQKQSSPTPAIPQSLPEALRLAAELAEQKEMLEQRQLLLEKELKQAAPKVEFANRVATANGILIGNFAKVIGLKQNFLFKWLRENKILIASGSRRNVPRQQYIDQEYFSVKEVIIDDEQYHRIALTTHITGKGQQWLTRRLLESGLLKTIANTPN
ncbi:phage antirepressor KilAC domain-containing protein [Salmonella enterica]|nr:phage antirepressor KilAC domain-containing protein [Salmonella enterica]EHK5999290.1 phage antirepressor KilAC domain-containing protein [Salmonella enterica]EIF5124628.1 phage antirepressor KilAC domain-containing protein [Salmonella enterica]EIF5348685.1 phage antirepressor KilAC domain-containing protein [Salmonella enterica]EIF5657282.1 phage antirepressor KilAC domain-containing protein [Salmonella enterica]